MALGYVEPGPGGETEVWYSADGEMLKLCNGRIVASAGLSTDWRDVRLPALPAWDSVRETPFRYTRERDEMPGYRLDIRDSVLLLATAPPTDSGLIGFEALKLAWYEERASALQDGMIALPVSRFAVALDRGKETVVFGEQCLAASLCLKWQRWPAPSGAGQ